MEDRKYVRVQKSLLIGEQTTEKNHKSYSSEGRNFQVMLKCIFIRTFFSEVSVIDFIYFNFHANYTNSKRHGLNIHTLTRTLASTTYIEFCFA